MAKEHRYLVNLNWEGNTGEGTANYRAYKRDYVLTAQGKELLHGSSDPSFRGDASRYNPEELFVASLSACHMLWYLHLCADAGIIVEEYTDNATGLMVEDDMRGGYFKEVVLHPRVVISNPSKQAEAERLHERANSMCFIANSCNFPVTHRPEIVVKDK